MDFTFSEDQLSMETAVRELLDDICSPGELRATAEGSHRARTDRWDALRAMGLFGVLAPEAAGGLGLTDTDFVLLAQAAGHAALPEPLVEQAGIVVPLLAGIGARAADLLEAASTGAMRVAIGVSGALVLGAETADMLLIEHEHEVHAVRREDAELTAQDSIDPTRKLSSVRFAPSQATRIADKAKGAPLWALARRRGAVTCAAQLCGLADRMTELAVDYTTQRKQFGKPIGSNQAVKHLMVNIAVKTEFAKPVVYAACAFLRAKSPRAELYAAHAKIAAGDAADLAARNAIQVHGAMGYSWEVDLHFYMKRAWALTASWGDRALHAKRVQHALLNGAIEIGPDQTFAA